MKTFFIASAESIHSFKWISFCHQLGHEVIWVSFAKSEFEIPKSIHYYEVLRKSKFLALFGGGFCIRRLISAHEPDLVQIHSVGFYGVLSLFVPRHIPIVATPWGSDVIFGKKNFLKKMLIQYCLRRARVITCDAFHMKREILMLTPEAPEKIRLINFGVDTKRFRKKQNASIPENIRYGGGPFNVLSTRNLEEVYDLETLIRAIPIVRSLNVDINVILVGSGSQADYLRLLCEELDVKQAVAFTGRIPNDDLINYLASSDLYVSTALSDAGIAASSAEAMSCELPVVLSDTGENSRWVSDGINGFLFPAKNPLELARTIVRALQLSSVDRERMGAKARETIINRNDFVTEMQKVDVLYRAALD